MILIIALALRTRRNYSVWRLFQGKTLGFCIDTFNSLPNWFVDRVNALTNHHHIEVHRSWLQYIQIWTLIWQSVSCRVLLYVEIWHLRSPDNNLSVCWSNTFWHFFNILKACSHSVTMDFPSVFLIWKRSSISCTSRARSVCSQLLEKC